MFILNFLPSLKKDFLRRRFWFIITKEVLCIFFVFFAFLSIVLLLSQFVLQNYFQEIARQTTVSMAPYQGIIQEMRQANQETKDIREIQSKYVPWSKFLIHLTSLVPDGVRFTSLKLEKNAKEVKIQGKADKRDQFLEFQSRLQQSPAVTTVRSPLANLFLKENLDFELELRLDPERIDNLF